MVRYTKRTKVKRIGPKMIGSGQSMGCYVNKYEWQCCICGRVWSKRYQAQNCC
jgi:hypothetical protein